MTRMFWTAVELTCGALSKPLRRLHKFTERAAFIAWQKAVAAERKGH